ncbi:MAG TPA: hypothetical protein VE258_19330, partial [Ktedonobacterales bacterium]|nr:hypothetical protein [Ktedonobacterales bacterium]
VQALEDMSPMPDDDAPQMTAELVDRYAELVGEIARELDRRFDTRAVGALVRSFGLGDGFETYWPTVHVIERFSHSEETYALIRAGTGDDAPGVRLWCCLLLGRRRDLRDLPLFIACLDDTEERVVVQALSSIRMLAQIHPVPAAIPSVVALVADPRPAVAAAARDALPA